MSYVMLTADQALESLLAGNERYVNAKLTHPHQTIEHRTALVEGQRPFAVILGCADSRVPPEIIFDHGLGDLFVVRVAGNVVDDIVLGSIEYAVLHLHTPLIMVLGHANCGAVVETLKGENLEGHLPSLVRAIKPAIDKIKDQSVDLLDKAIRANANRSAEQIRAARPILYELVKADKLKVVTAYYDLASGKVEVIS